MTPHKSSERSVGWMGLKRGHRAKPLEWLAEKLIFLVSLSAILMIFLIFVFIGREAIPVAFGRMDSSLTQKAMAVEDMDKISPRELQDYLGLTDKQFAGMDRETRQALMESKLDEVKSLQGQGRRAQHHALEISPRTPSMERL